jgi:hypothetical protein
MQTGECLGFWGIKGTEIPLVSLFLQAKTLFLQEPLTQALKIGKVTI